MERSLGQLCGCRRHPSRPPSERRLGRSKYHACQHVIRENWAHSATRRLPRFLIGHPVLSVQQAAAGLNISVPAANAALNNLLAAGIVSLVNERQWGRVFQATPVLRRLDQLPAPRQGP